MSIQVENINKFYDKQRVLNNISFELNTGEITGFLGPNGAGKSTLMKILTCYISPSSGNAFVAGYNIKTEKKALKQSIGYLPEHNPLYLNLYVKEYLEFVYNVYKLKGNKRESILKCIEDTGLQKEQNKKIGTLSKGYRQRVGLAQAIIHNPKVLILDEPTTGLDPNQIEEIRTLIKSIGRDKTIILSTHIMQEVEAICDRVLIINKGNLVANDNIENLSSLNKKDAKITIEVKFKETNIPTSIFKAINGIKQVSEINAHTLVFEIEEEDVQNKIMSLAIQNHINIQSINRYKDSVESIFKTLTI